MDKQYNSPSWQKDNVETENRGMVKDIKLGAERPVMPPKQAPAGPGSDSYV